MKAGPVVQDWKPQVFNFGPKEKQGGPKRVTEAEASRRAQGGEQVDSTKKQFQHSNQQHNDLGQRARKLDECNDEYRVPTVSFNVAGGIQRARQAKNWTQADLGREICEKASVVNDYEAGRAVPNEQVLQKMERALGIHLRGVKAGEPMEPKKFKKKKE